jgi:hypothetical protein
LLLGNEEKYALNFATVATGIFLYFSRQMKYFFWKINGFCCLEMKENTRCMFSLCLKNPLSANYEVGQNVPSVKNFVGLNCRRSKLPSVKITVGQN